MRYRVRTDSGHALPLGQDRIPDLILSGGSACECSGCGLVAATRIRVRPRIVTIAICARVHLVISRRIDAAPPSVTPELVAAPLAKASPVDAVAGSAPGCGPHPEDRKEENKRTVGAAW